MPKSVQNFLNEFKVGEIIANRAIKNIATWRKHISFKEVRIRRPFLISLNDIKSKIHLLQKMAIKT